MTLNVYFLYKKQSNFQVGDSHAILCKEMQRISRMARELIESLEKNEALDDMISRLILYDLVGTIQMDEYESVESLVKELLKPTKMELLRMQLVLYSIVLTITITITTS